MPARKEFSKADCDMMVRRYYSGESIYTIRKAFGVDKRVIGRVFSELGVTIRPRHETAKRSISTLPEKVVASIIDHCRNGLRQTEIAAIEGVSVDKVRYVVRKFSYGRLSHTVYSRYRSINEYSFLIDSADRNYWLGFLMADGNIYVRGSGAKVISILLAGKDFDHLQKFAEFIGYDGRFYDHKGSGFAGSKDGKRISISSAVMASSLNLFGVFERKSGKEAFDDTLAMDPDVWRGYLDGDGWVSVCSNVRPMIGLCGSFEVCNQFSDFCKSLGVKSCTISKNGESIWSCNISGEQVTKVLDVLYNRPGPALRRKQIAAHAILAADWSSKYVLKAKIKKIHPKPPTTAITLSHAPG